MSYAVTVSPSSPNISLRLININIDVATSLLGRGDLTDFYFGISPCVSSIEQDGAAIG
jgi:hypothetical protein